MPLRYACTSTPSSSAVGIALCRDERQREVGLRELLLGVVHVARVADRRGARRPRCRARRGRRRRRRRAHAPRGTRARCTARIAVAHDTDGRVATRRAWPRAPRAWLRVRSWAAAPAAAICPEWSTRGAALARGLAERNEPRTASVSDVAEVDLRELVRPGTARYGPGAAACRARARAARCAGLRPLLELDQEVHVAGERGVGEQLQRDERQSSAAAPRAKKVSRDQAAQHEQHVAAALLLPGSWCRDRRWCTGPKMGGRGADAGPCAAVPVGTAERAEPVVEVTDRVGPDLVVACPEDRGGQEGDPRQTQDRDQTRIVNAPAPCLSHPSATYQGPGVTPGCSLAPRSPRRHPAFGTWAP